MKTRPLNNYDATVGVEVYDVDLENQEELLELGRLAADQCIVFWNQKISTEKLFEIQKENKSITEAVNLGTKNGYSVKEIIQKAKEITGVDFKVETAQRRPGDPDKLVANVSKAKEFLGWEAQKSDLETIISSAWKWYKKGEELKKQSQRGYL
jgi:GDP-D-mannose dehydratase